MDTIDIAPFILSHSKNLKTKNEYDDNNTSIINRVPVPKPELDVAIQCIHDSIVIYIGA